MMLRKDKKMGNTQMQTIWALRNRDKREPGKEERMRKGETNREGKREEEKIRDLDEYEYRMRLHKTRKGKTIAVIPSCDLLFFVQLLDRVDIEQKRKERTATNGNAKEKREGETVSARVRVETTGQDGLRPGKDSDGSFAVSRVEKDRAARSYHHRSGKTKKNEERREMKQL